MGVQTKLLLIIISIVFLFGGTIGYFAGNKYKKCPEITGIKTDTVLVSVPSKDTSVTTDTVIKVVSKVVTRYVHDTVNQLVPIQVMTTCYTFDMMQKDSAYTKVEICSDSLPKTKPLDAQAIFTYVPPPLKEKIVTNTVTVTEIKPAKFWDWKMYSLTILAALAGGYAIANH